MPKVSALTMDTITSKSGRAVTIAFPDVCKTSTPAGPVPIPYPNIAQTATARKESLKTQKTKSPYFTGSSTRTSMGNEPGTLKGVVASRSSNAGSRSTASNAGKVQLESQQLRGRLNALNQQLQSLPGTDPDRWQNLLQDYAVTASALYMTLLPLDD
jgi:hypothetical protein